jgi:hypothetical protein
VEEFIMRYLMILLLLAATVLAQAPAPALPVLDTVTGLAPVDAFRETWYSKHLRAMGESQLTEDSAESYRFLFLRTFHDPVAVRISCAERNCDLTAVRLDGSGGYEPGSVAERKSTKLSEQETSRIRALIGTARFWEKPPADTRIGLDGAQWILEGRRQKTYHLWDVWSPEKIGPHAAFRDLCLEILRVSKIKIEQSEIY